MKPLLSLLCPSIRMPFMDQRLLEQVKSSKYQNQVELIILHDNDWSSIGDKQRQLYEISRGEYLMYIADDDIVSPALLPRTLDLLNPSKVEGVSFDIAMHANTETGVCKVNPGEFCDDDPTLVEKWVGGIQYRPWHPISITRRDLYGRIVFPNSSQGEDNAILRTMVPHIYTAHQWLYIPEVFYRAFPIIGRKPYARKVRYE